MAKTVYLGITGDIIHPGIINIINVRIRICCFCSYYLRAYFTKGPLKNKTR